MVQTRRTQLPHLPWWTGFDARADGKHQTSFRSARVGANTNRHGGRNQNLETATRFHTHSGNQTRRNRSRLSAPHAVFLHRTGRTRTRNVPRTLETTTRSHTVLVRWKHSHRNTSVSSGPGNSHQPPSTQLQTGMGGSRLGTTHTTTERRWKTCHDGQRRPNQGSMGHDHPVRVHGGINEPLYRLHVVHQQYKGLHS